MDNYIAMAAIEDHINNHLFEPASNWPRYQFKKRSYERYAAYKVLSMIANGNGIPALRIISDFVELIRKRKSTDNSEANFIFHVIEDVATDIYDILRAMQ